MMEQFIVLGKLCQSLHFCEIKGYKCLQKGQQQSATLAAAQKAADVLKVSESLALEVIILLSSTWENQNISEFFVISLNALN